MMQRITITIPETLKTRIESTKENFGWNGSECVRNIFDYFDFLHDFMNKYMIFGSTEPLPKEIDKMNLINLVQKWV